MNSSIFKTGESSSFAKRSRQMYKLLTLGAGALALVYCVFMQYYFIETSNIKLLSWGLSAMYLISFLLSYTKISNVKLYEIIFGVFVITSFFLLFVAYRCSFNSEYIILMLAIFSVILIALPNPKQLLIYFGFVFIPLETALFLSETSFGFSLLISISFGAIFILSYVISKQKSILNYRSYQNARILKTMVNNTNDSILLVDVVSNQIQDANENTKESFGLNDTNELISKHFHKLFKEEGFIELRKEKIAQKISEDGYYQSDAMFKRKDGSSFLGRLHLSPFEAVDKKFYLLQIKNAMLKH